MADSNNGQTGPTGASGSSDPNAGASGASGASGATGPAANSGSNSGSNASKDTIDKQLLDIQEQMADNPRPDKDAPADIHREWKQLIDGLSSKAAALRKQQIAKDPNLSDDEKDVLKLYDEGVQIFSIAARVYKFANQQTVGLVSLIIRKAHANDWDQTEDVNSTKGYTGIGAGTGLPQA